MMQSKEYDYHNNTVNNIYVSLRVYGVLSYTFNFFAEM